LMFATKPWLFSIGTIVIPTLVWSNQPIKLSTSVGLNLVEQVIKPIELVFETLVLSDIPIKLVPIRLVKIVIPPDTFQQHLPKTFFQHEVGEMEIDDAYSNQSSKPSHCKMDYH
jgi:hypothetical protein